MRLIQCKFVEYLIVPTNAIGGFGEEYQTLDGKTCRLKVFGVYKNEHGETEEQLDAYCRHYYGCSFRAIRSIWLARMGSLSEYWYQIRLIEVKD